MTQPSRAPACYLRPGLVLRLLLALGLLVHGSLSCDDWQESLTLHNTLRALHGSPAMVWDTTLAAFAQNWSDGLAAKGCGLAHSSGPYGENLLMSWIDSSKSPSCSGATNRWYEEVSNYKFTSTPWTDNGPNFGAIGHFTQVVWKNTARLGCASSNGIPGANGWTCYVVTCSYGPPGNYVDNTSFMRNVFPLGGVQVAFPPSPSPPPSPPPRPISPSPPPRPPPSCVDVSLAASCALYLSQGLCTNALTPWVKNRYCQATCNNCPVLKSPPPRLSPPPPPSPSPPSAPASTAPAGDCVDLSLICSQFSAQGLCTSSSMPYIKSRYCQLTCGACIPEASVPPACQDASPFCAAMLSVGLMCNIPAVAASCQATCNVCP